MIIKRHLFVNELASSRAKTVSVTTATTWCGTLNESKSAWFLWKDTLYGCPVQNWQGIKTEKASGDKYNNWITSSFFKYYNNKLIFGSNIWFLPIWFSFEL